MVVEDCEWSVCCRLRLRPVDRSLHPGLSLKTVIVWSVCYNSVRQLDFNAFHATILNLLGYNKMHTISSECPA